MRPDQDRAVTTPPAGDLIKCREIDFVEPHPDQHQANSAVDLLLGLDGIVSAAAPTPTRLLVTYRLPELSLELVEEMLSRIGFHLDNSLLAKLRRALVHYTEDTQCANLGCTQGQSNCTVKVFVNRYQHIRHGCRDSRPPHWRDYH